MRTSHLNNQYLKLRARQGECKALLVNICLDWQSQPLPPQPPASLLAPLCLHSSQPTAQRDAPGEAGDRLAATRGCTGRWARPVPRPLCQQPRGHPSVSLGHGTEIRWEVSLDSKQTAFPGGAPQIYVFLISEESKAEDKTLGACSQIVAHHLLRRRTALRRLYQWLPAEEPTPGPLGSCLGPRGLEGPLTGEAVDDGGWLYLPAEVPALTSLFPESHSFIRPFSHLSAHQLLLGIYLYQALGAGHTSGQKQTWTKSLWEEVPRAKKIPPTNGKSQQRQALG